MISKLTDAQKLDILLSFKKEYNLVDTEDPSMMKMSLGNGYTIFASVKRSWYIEFNDGLETTSYDVESPKVPYTNSRDARTLCKKYRDECKRALDEIKGVSAGEPDVKTEGVADSERIIHTHMKDASKLIKGKLKGQGVENNGSFPNIKTKKNKNRVEVLNHVGMKLPIVYPSEMKGSFMMFKQWTADNDVIPKNSEVVILDEGEFNFRVTIPQAHISFDIQKDKVEVIMEGGIA